MVIEESIIINADIRKVWETFTDLTCWADWNTVLGNVSCGEGTCISEGGSFSCSIKPFVIPVFFEPKIEEVIPYKKVVWTANKMGVYARHEFLFESVNDSVIVRSKETFTGLPLSVASVLFPRSTIEQLTVHLLTDLKTASEKIRYLT